MRGWGILATVRVRMNKGFGLEASVDFSVQTFLTGDASAVGQQVAAMQAAELLHFSHFCQRGTNAPNTACTGEMTCINVSVGSSF